MPTLFDAPSPSGRNNARLYLDSKGHLLDRYGRHWGGSQIRKMAFDALPPDLGTGEKPKKPMNWHASAARNDLNAALKKLCDVMGWEHEDAAGQVDDILAEHERKQVQEHAAALGVGGGKGAGKGALDKAKGAAARDDDDEEDEIDERVRKLLRGKGLADDDVEKAIELARKDREEARDSRPQPATRGGFGGRFSGATKDVESEYGGGHLLDLPDYTPDPDRFGSGYDPLKGRDPARNLPGRGISRTLSNDAAIASDAEFAREYPGIENVGTSEWGR
jgi:GNAT superfamily N-acetyltransferase